MEGEGTVTVIAGEQQRDVPTALQEGGRVPQLPLGPHGAGARVELQPSRRVVQQRVAVGAGARNAGVTLRPPSTCAPEDAPRFPPPAPPTPHAHVRVCRRRVSGSLAV